MNIAFNTIMLTYIKLKLNTIDNDQSTYYYDKDTDQRFASMKVRLLVVKVKGSKLTLFII